MPSKRVSRIRLVAGTDSSLSEERDPGDRGMYNLDSDPLQGAGRSIGRRSRSLDLQVRSAIAPRAGRRAGAKSGTQRLARVGKRRCAGCACGYPAYFPSDRRSFELFERTVPTQGRRPLRLPGTDDAPCCASGPGLRLRQSAPGPARTSNLPASRQMRVRRLRAYVRTGCGHIKWGHLSPAPIGDRP